MAFYKQFQHIAVDSQGNTFTVNLVLALGRMGEYNAQKRKWGEGYGDHCLQSGGTAGDPGRFV